MHSQSSMKIEGPRLSGGMFKRRPGTLAWWLSTESRFQLLLSRVGLRFLEEMWSVAQHRHPLSALQAEPYAFVEEDDTLDQPGPCCAVFGLWRSVHRSSNGN